MGVIQHLLRKIDFLRETAQEMSNFAQKSIAQLCQKVVFSVNGTKRGISDHSYPLFRDNRLHIPEEGKALPFFFFFFF